MILASRKFVRAVPEAWFLSTVENDDVKIIKMFYDNPVWYVYDIVRCVVLYHTTTRYHIYHK